MVSREECGLCEEMFAQLEVFCADKDLLIEIVDVDADPLLNRRFGHKVPVLLLDGEPVCHGHFDAQELRRLLR